MSGPLRLRVDPAVPEAALLREAADTLARGGVVAYPTDTLYGLAVDPRQAEAVERLYRIKAREAGRPIPLVAAGVAQVEAVALWSPLAERLASRFWPGPLTLVLEARPAVLSALLGGADRVAVRVPDHAIARGLAAAAGHPITSTSANLSGHPPPATADEVLEALGPVLDLILDGGPVPGGLPSTIVDATGSRPRLVRAGAVSWARVLESGA